MLRYADETAPLLDPAAPRTVGFAAHARPERDADSDAEPFRFLVARPAARTDLASVTEIAGHVNLASMRAEREKNELAIEQSIRTLAGDLAWQQGLVLLSADLIPQGGGPRELAGNVRLQAGWGGCWKKETRARLFNFPGLRTWAEQETLTYQPNADDEYTLEFAGLAVSPDHQGKKISRFLADAWALFVLLHQEELRRRVWTIVSLYANLLTADADGRYPFYERVVRPLLGNLDYHAADALRYARCGARSPFLDEFLDRRGGQPRASVPCHLLPDDIRAGLGAVREQTRGCQRNLERLGFARADKYDVLDGGQYFENTIERLDRRLSRQEYRARRARPGEVRRQAVRVTLATADRPPPYFRCARVRCRPDGDELWLGEEAFDELMLRHHERVAVLGAQQSGEAAR